MDTRTLVWSVQAQADAAAIFEFYNHQNGNSDYSDRLLFEFDKRMNYVVDGPYSGWRAKQKGFRYVLVYPFQLFYYVTKKEVVVAKVWDARRDPDTLKLTR